MLQVERTEPDDVDPSLSQLANVVVSPCPRCPLLYIHTKDPRYCYHMTCATCRQQYCGICSFQNRDGTWVKSHSCVDGGSIFSRSESRRQAVLSTYADALA